MLSAFLGGMTLHQTIDRFLDEMIDNVFINPSDNFCCDFGGHNLYQLSGYNMDICRRYSLQTLFPV